MGVITTWDEQRDILEESLQNAQNAIMSMINPDTWGYSDISTSAILKYEELFIKIVQLRREMNS